MTSIKFKAVLPEENNLFQEIGKYRIPVWAITYLVYGDASGLEDNEEEIIVNWLTNEFRSEGWTSLTFEFHGDKRECYLNPAFGDQMCDIELCTVWGRKE